jgi:hypothetical protein
MRGHSSFWGHPIEQRQQSRGHSRTQLKAALADLVAGHAEIKTLLAR